MLVDLDSMRSVTSVQIWDHCECCCLLAPLRVASVKDVVHRTGLELEPFADLPNGETLGPECFDLGPELLKLRTAVEVASTRSVATRDTRMRPAVAVEVIVDL